MFIFPVQLTTCRIGNLTRLIHTLAIFVAIGYIVARKVPRRDKQNIKNEKRNKK